MDDRFERRHFGNLLLVPLQQILQPLILWCSGNCCMKKTPMWCFTFHPGRYAIDDQFKSWPATLVHIAENVRHVPLVTMLQRRQNHVIARRRVFVERAQADPGRIPQCLNICFSKAPGSKRLLQSRSYFGGRVQHA